jgi:hypothetical protein
MNAVAAIPKLYKQIFILLEFGKGLQRYLSGHFLS